VIILTYHAVEQYISRFDRTMSATTAWEELNAQIAYADRLKDRSLRGDTLWRLPGGAYLITKNDGVDDVAVTVLSEGQVPLGVRHDQPTEEELELLLDRVPEHIPLPATGEQRTLALTVTVTYTLGLDNVPLVEEKLRNAIEAVLRNMQKGGVARAKIDGFECRKAGT
jgi:hypothetical protein